MIISKLTLALIASVFQAFSTCVVLKKLLDYKSNKDIIKIFILTYIYCVLACLYVPNPLRFGSAIIFTSILLYFIVGFKNKSVLIYALNLELLILVSEIFVSIILVIFGINSKEIVTNSFYNLIANILISLVTVALISLKFVLIILKKILYLFNKNKFFNKYAYLLFIVIYLIFTKNGLEFILKSNYYINILVLVFVMLILVVIINNESKYEILEDQNKQMLNYVTKYEKIITEQGKANHEFKNQLMVIKNYAKLDKNKLNEYIDSIVEDSKKTQSSYLISQLNNFPDGGIKGLLYYKLSIIEDNKIKYEIQIDNNVKTKLKKITIEMNKNITKILGVLLDNAIDASKVSKRKKIIITVSYVKNNVIFTISNTYSGKIDITSVEKGKTSKGKGHGYGLRLVNDIIKENNYFKIERVLEDDYFTTNLFVNLKK